MMRHPRQPITQGNCTHLRVQSAHKHIDTACPAVQNSDHKPIFVSLTEARQEPVAVPALRDASGAMLAATVLGALDGIRRTMAEVSWTVL